MKSIIYCDNGDNSFTEQTSITLTDVRGSGIWGDYNNDGYLDILLAGWSESLNSSVCLLYRNNCDNTFTEVNLSTLDFFSPGMAALGDYDNDGDLDILLIGGQRKVGWQ